jgi:hypothetical protein
VEDLAQLAKIELHLLAVIQLEDDARARDPHQDGLRHLLAGPTPVSHEEFTPAP